MLEEAPVKEKIHIEVMSKRKGFGFSFKVRTVGSYFHRLKLLSC